MFTRLMEKQAIKRSEKNCSALTIGINFNFESNQQHTNSNTFMLHKAKDQNIKLDLTEYFIGDA